MDKGSKASPSAGPGLVKHRETEANLGQRLAYGLFLALAHAVAIWPTRWLHGFSFLIYGLVYKVLGYRRRVVRQNLERSFPARSPAERAELERGFYRYFSDFILESIKAVRLSRAEQQERFVFENPELVESLYEKGKSIVLVSGHYGNWEWSTHFSLLFRHVSMAAYRPLANPLFDGFMRRLRERHGTRLVPQEGIYRAFVESMRAGRPVIAWFIADQSPSHQNGHWTRFLNQDTQFVLGPARVARKTGQAFVFMGIDRVGRGRYRGRFELLAEDASRHSEAELVEGFARWLEARIEAEPRLWLWTHKRWKRGRPQAPPAGA